MFTIFKSVKKIIAILCTLVFLFLSVTNKISSEQFMTVFSLIIGTYFGQSVANNKDK
jgi:hypothetical protein